MSNGAPMDARFTGAFGRGQTQSRNAYRPARYAQGQGRLGPIKAQPRRNTLTAKAVTPAPAASTNYSRAARRKPLLGRT